MPIYELLKQVRLGGDEPVGLAGDEPNRTDRTG